MSDARRLRPDPGPGKCEVDGCQNERYFFNSFGYVPCCATHALERIKRAVADMNDWDGDTGDIG